MHEQSTPDDPDTPAPAETVSLPATPPPEAPTAELLTPVQETASALTSEPAAPRRERGSRLGTGDRVGPFTLEEELGRGGMGVVFAATHPTLGRRVALKVLFADRVGEDARQRFAVEARAAARLRHPGVVGVHEVGEEGGDPFLVMDLIEGEALGARLQRDGPLPPREAATLCRALAEALSYAHGRGVLHRDLKPSNVLLTPQGAPVLTDFGLAKELHTEQGLTESGVVMGTPCYMPPEQALGRTDVVDQRSDVYSLGATLYELLVGRPPFEGATALAILNAVVSQEPTPVRSLRAEVPIDLATICHACLGREPEARYASAQALADDLGRYLRDEPIEARPPSAVETAVKWIRRNRRLAGSVALTAGIGLVALLGGGVLHLRRLNHANTQLNDANMQLNDANTQLNDANTQLNDANTQLSTTNTELARTNKALERANHDLDQKTKLAEQRGQLAEQREQIAVSTLDGIVAGFESKLLEPSDPLVRAFRSDVLRAALKHLERLDALRGPDQKRPPLSRAKAHFELARLSMLQNKLDAAERELNAAFAGYRAALAAETGEGRAPALFGLALAHGATGDLRIARGDAAGGLAAAKEAVVKADELARLAPAAHSSTIALRLLHGRLGERQIEAGDLAAARLSLEAGLKAARAAVAHERASDGDREALAAALSRAAGLALQQQRSADALKLCREQLTITRPLSDAQPTNRRRARIVIIALERISGLSDPAGAITALQEALARQEALVDRDPGNTLLRGFAGHLGLALGNRVQASGNVDAAYEVYARAATHCRALLASDPKSVGGRFQFVQALTALAAIQESRGDFVRAVGLFELAHQTAKELVAEQKPDPGAAAIAARIANARRYQALEAGKLAPASPADQLFLAYTRYNQRRFAESTAAFAAALKDAAVRADLNRSNLYNAACAAALAAAAAKPDAVTALQQQALTWLGDDLRLRRAALESAPADQKAAHQKALDQHLTWAREKDTDLASLRGLSAFKALFPN